MRLRNLAAALFMCFALLSAAHAQNNISVVGSMDASQITSGSLNYLRLPIGSGANTVAAGNDSRFLNATSINGQVITALTGVIKFTNGTPSAASAADIAGLFGTCNSSTPILSYNGTTGACIAVSGTGTVTSVGVAAPSSIFAVANTPITASGTITLSYATGQTPNQVFGTNGSGAVGLMSLSSGMIPAINLAGTGNGGVTGSLPAASVSGLATSATTDATNATNITSGTLSAARLPAGVQTWQKVTIASTALTAAATTQAVTILNLAARQAVCGIVEKTTTAFSGSFSALTVTVGDSAGSATTYAPNPYDLKQAVSNTAFQANNVVGLASFAGGTIQANFTATGGNLSSQTGGSVDFSVCTVTLP